MEITLQDFERQLQIVQTYRDDQFAALLKRCADEMKAAKQANAELDVRRKAITADEKLCAVIQGSQAEFNRWKSAEEAKIADRRAKTQTAKDNAASELDAARADRAEATEYKLAAEGMLQEAEKKRKSAENKDIKAAQALEKAEEYKAQFAAKLESLGLKAA